MLFSSWKSWRYSLRDTKYKQDNWYVLAPLITVADPNQDTMGLPTSIWPCEDSSAVALSLANQPGASTLQKTATAAA